MLTPADMERVLESLDRRLTAIEQQLPTLATAAQLDAMARATAEQFDAMARATAGQLEDVKQFARTLNEQTNDSVRLVAEGLADLARRVDDLPTRQEFGALSARVDDVTMAVRGIARELSSVGEGVTTLTTRLEQRGVI